MKNSKELPTSGQVYVCARANEEKIKRSRGSVTFILQKRTRKELGKKIPEIYRSIQELQLQIYDRNRIVYFKFDRKLFIFKRKIYIMLS